MKRTIQLITLTVCCILIAACTATEHIDYPEKTRISVQAGIAHGGIVENTDMSVVPESSPPPEAKVDAFTGATSMGANAGVHIIQPLGRIAIETGVDYLYHYQQFYYIDAGHFAMGQRDLRVSQLAIPFRLQVPLLRRLLPGAEMSIRLGYTGEVNLVDIQNSGILPEYAINRWSNGASVGFSMYPFSLKNDDRIGLYIDLYRGSAAFEDYYNQSTFEEPGTSFVKAGIAYKF